MKLISKYRYSIHAVLQEIFSRPFFFLLFTLSTLSACAPYPPQTQPVWAVHTSDLFTSLYRSFQPIKVADALGNTFTVHALRNATAPDQFDLVLTKIDSAGGIQWTTTLPQQTTTPMISAATTTLSVDSANNIYLLAPLAVVGPTASSSDYNTLLAKVDTLGNIIWQQTKLAADQIDLPLQLTLGRDNQLYTVELHADNIDSGILISAYDLAGNLLWSQLKAANILASLPNTGAAALSAEGTSNNSIFYLLGLSSTYTNNAFYFTYTEETFDEFSQPTYVDVLIKLDATGQSLYEVRDTATAQRTLKSLLGSNPAGDLYITKTINNVGSVQKRADNGTILWQKDFNSAFLANLTDSGELLTVAPSADGTLLQKYGPDGLVLAQKKLWAKSIFPVANPTTHLATGIDRDGFNRNYLEVITGHCHPVGCTLLTLFPDLPSLGLYTYSLEIIAFDNSLNNLLTIVPAIQFRLGDFVERFAMGPNRQFAEFDPQGNLYYGNVEKLIKYDINGLLTNTGI